MSKQSDWDVRVTHATNGWLTVLVAHSAGQINGHTLYMSKQYDWDVCVTHATNGWLTVLLDPGFESTTTTPGVFCQCLIVTKKIKKKYTVLFNLNPLLLLLSWGGEEVQARPLKA